MELSPETEARLRRKAERAGQSVSDYLVAVADATEEDAEGSAYDLFEGLIGRVGSDGDGQWSQDTGRKFAEGMAEKRRQGQL